jgi:hypothetical protein
LKKVVVLYLLFLNKKEFTLDYSQAKSKAEASNILRLLNNRGNYL